MHLGQIITKKLPCIQGKTLAEIIIHLGQKRSKILPCIWGKTSAIITLHLGQKRRKINNPASRAKHDHKLSCIWGKI
jgi:hypothetical protein